MQWFGINNFLALVLDFDLPANTFNLALVAFSPFFPAINLFFLTSDPDIGDLSNIPLRE